MKFKSKRGFVQLVAVFIAFALIIVAGSVTILASKPNRTRGFEHICQKFPDNAACRSPKPTTFPIPLPSPTPPADEISCQALGICPSPKPSTP